MQISSPTYAVPSSVDIKVDAGYPLRVAKNNGEVVFNNPKLTFSTDSFHLLVELVDALAPMHHRSCSPK